MKTHLTCLGIVVWLGTGGPGAAQGDSPTPWRMSRALDLPHGWEVSGSHRVRYETLDGQFRQGLQGGDQMLALRTLLRLEAGTDRFGLGAEWQDSRQALADTGTPLDTTMVNAVELLQAHGIVRFDGPFCAGARSELRLGRQTLDIGSRRLVARNEFRNTLNAFTGVRYVWERPEGPVVQGFHVLPLTRLPSDAPSLLHNQVQLDEESFRLQFWGVHAQWPVLMSAATAEVYLYGLHERDSARHPTRNRQLYTPGLRLSRRPLPEQWDFDFEGALQLGSQRASAAPHDTRDLDHLAGFAHAEIGYTWAVAGAPRLAVLYDYASGDKNPDDGRSNRFDTLYGARRFDHGPTGIYGAFARANLHSTGLRAMIKPVRPLELMSAYRACWLASAKDAWTTSGLRDPTGRSGAFLGHQIEARVRWDLWPGNLRLDCGWAQLFAGGFIRHAPQSTHRGNTAYGYAALELTF